MNADVETLVAAKIRWAWDNGCPVAAHDATVAAIARRRWDPFPRRNTAIPDNTENRIDDLARGVAEKFTDGGWPMVGPSFSDYQWLCEQLAPVLAEDE